LLPEFFDKRLASWNTENIYQTPIHDLEELKLRIGSFVLGTTIIE
jgi:hypothetical protein